MQYEKPTLDFISRLRRGESVKFLDPDTKLFHHFQINKSEKRVCWERYVSYDRRNFVKWNVCLHIRDILDFRALIAVKNQARCFNTTYAD